MRSKKVVFELSMPNVGSWNGRWTGEGKPYIAVRSVPGEVAEAIDGKYFRYDFGDGWSAGITAEVMGAREAAKLLRKSEGFMWYGWMIDSIIKRGEITYKKEGV